MSRFAAIFTSDAALVRCELDRVRGQISLDEDGAAAGVGAYQDNVVLQRRYGVGVPRAELWDVPDSSSALLASVKLDVGEGLEENAQPFRFRQWLFAHVGQVDRADAVRDRLHDQLPEYLQSVVRGATLSEVIFVQFLAELRALGRTEDPNLEAPIAAQLLIKTAKVVEQVSSEVGGTAKANVGLVATNGRLLVAARRGNQSVAYKLLEGAAECSRCGLGPDARDADPLVRDHRRRRSVVVATNPTRVDSWVVVPDGGALAVDRRLVVQVL